MRKRKVLVIMAMAAALLSACQTERQEVSAIENTVSEESEVTESLEESQTVQDSELATLETKIQAEAQAEPSIISQETGGETRKESKFKMISGKVTDEVGNHDSVTIQTRDGGEYTLKADNADIAFSYDDTLVGYDIVLVYKGDLKTRKESSTEVIQILSPSGAARIDLAVGEIVNDALSTFTIKTEDGKEINFLKNNCEGSAPDIFGSRDSLKLKIDYIEVYDGENTTYYPLKIKMQK